MAFVCSLYDLLFVLMFSDCNKFYVHKQAVLYKTYKGLELNTLEQF